MATVLQRIKIRKKLMELLKKNAQVGNKVFSARPNSIFLEELPCIILFFNGEQNEILSGSQNIPKNLNRKCRVNIDVVSEERDGVEDDLDKRAFEVESTIYADPTLGGLTMGGVLLSTEPISITSDGDRDVAGIRMVWEFPYDGDATLDLKLDEFLNFNMKQIDPEDGAVLTESETVIREK